ncbi:MAG TPA: DUF4129 domain-containing protein [Acidimicrobiales bacterium]|nr:DUF4129 domain-containing protein [Acidimicrobiales bacterium]
MRLGPRQIWGGGVLFAGLGLLALVALASEEAPFDVKDDTGALRAPSWISVVLVVLIIGLIAFAALLMISAQRVTGGPVRLKRRRGLLNTLVVVGITALLFVLLHASGTPHLTKPNASPSTNADDGSGRAGGARRGGPPWAAITLGSAVLLVLGASGLMRRQMIDEATVPDDDVRESALVSLQRSLDALGAPGDDRSAIISAYVALLAGLAAAGVARRPEEAPEEYVRRVLIAVDVRPAPLHELTVLFAEARFSEHPMNADHRRRAVAALEAARGDLVSTAT